MTATRYDGNNGDNYHTVGGSLCDASTEKKSSFSRIKSCNHPAVIVEGRQTETEEEKEKEVAGVSAVEVQRPTSVSSLMRAPHGSIQHHEHLGRSMSDDECTHHLGYVQQNAGYSLDFLPPPPLPQYQYPHQHGQVLPSVQGITIGDGDGDGFIDLVKRLQVRNDDLARLGQEVAALLKHNLQEERLNSTQMEYVFDRVIQVLHIEVSKILAETARKKEADKALELATMKYQVETRAMSLKHASELKSAAAGTTCLACGCGGSQAGKERDKRIADDNLNDDDDDDDGVGNALSNFLVPASPLPGSRLGVEESGGSESMAMPPAAVQSAARYAASNGVHWGNDAISDANHRQCPAKQFSSDRFDTINDYYGSNDRRSNEEKTHLISPTSFGTGIGSQNSKHLPTDSIGKPTPYDHGSSTAKHDDDQAREGGKSQKITHSRRAATVKPQWQYEANKHHPSINPREEGIILLSSFVDTHWGENGAKVTEILKLIGLTIDPSPGSQMTGTISDLSWEEHGDLSAAAAADSSLGEEQVAVVNKDFTDPYGDHGKYTGNVLVSTGLPHGKGRMEYAAVGKTYYGHWRNGRQYGFGRATFSNGDSFEGIHVADHHHGKGVFTWNNGAIYNGEFDHHVRHGKGLSPDPSVRSTMATLSTEKKMDMAFVRMPMVDYIVAGGRMGASAATAHSLGRMDDATAANGKEV